MINVKPIIYEQLKGLSISEEQISDSYPANWTNLPTVQYIEENNTTHLKCDGKEKIALIRYKIDIWHNRSTSDLALNIDGIFSSMGFNRIQCLDVAEASGLKHKIIRYEGKINIETLKLFDK